jgi:hypothetical protein
MEISMDMEHVVGRMKERSELWRPPCVLRVGRANTRTVKGTRNNYVPTTYLSIYLLTNNGSARS